MKRWSDALSNKRRNWRMPISDSSPEQRERLQADSGFQQLQNELFQAARLTTAGQMAASRINNPQSAGRLSSQLGHHQLRPSDFRGPADLTPLTEPFWLESGAAGSLGWEERKTKA